MTSTVPYGGTIKDNEVRKALSVAAAEITALSGNVAASLARVGTGVPTLVVNTDTSTALIANLYALKQSLIAAGLLGQG